MSALGGPDAYTESDAYTDLRISLSNAIEAPSIRVAPAFILVHFFSEGPLKRRNSLNTHISRNYEILNEKQ